METNVQDLLNKYEEIYLSRSRDFNALTTVHLSENDHTNILREILNMQVNGKKPFMESFVRDVLGIEYQGCNKLVAKTQIASIGNNEKGFIDLLIEGDDIKIVIENKVCGAVDMPYQLSRYYFSFVYEKDILRKYFKDKEFIEQCSNYWQDNNRPISKDEVYIVYLSETADKIPDKKSIPERMRDDLSNDKHYIPISYEEHIYDWLKTKVLPLIPYGKSGDAHMSIILYLRELENIFASNTSQNQWYLETKELQDLIREITKECQTNVKKYTTLDNIYKNLTEEAKKEEYKDNSILTDLISCVLCWRNNVFGQYATEGWTVYCDGTYIKFYPTRWKEKYGGSTACNIHFLFNNWNKDNKVAIFDFNIHGDACKNYIITKQDEAYKSFYKEISSYTNEWNKEEDQIKDKSTIKKNQWHLRFDPIASKVEWMPNDNKAITTFFRELVESNEIQKLVKYIDDNFK